MDGGHICCNINIDVLWLNFPWQGQYWRGSSNRFDDFPIWDGRVASRIAVAAAGIHQGVRHICPLLELEEVLYCLYTRVTSELYLVINDYDPWVQMRFHICSPKLMPPWDILSVMPTLCG